MQFSLSKHRFDKAKSKALRQKTIKIVDARLAATLYFGKTVRFFTIRK